MKEGIFIVIRISVRILGDLEEPSLTVRLLPELLREVRIHFIDDALCFDSVMRRYSGWRYTTRPATIVATAAPLISAELRQ